MSKQFMPLVVPVMMTVYFALAYFVPKKASAATMSTSTKLAMKCDLMFGKSLDNAAKSIWGSTGTSCLFVFRLAGVLFFSLPFAGDAWYVMTFGSTQFTEWNIAFIVVYYMLASLSSILFYFSEVDSVHVKALIMRYGDYLGKITSTMFVVMISNALFITVVNFSLLDQGFYWKNLVVHLFNSLFAIVEFSLNSVHIERSDILFSAGWVYIYLIHVWIAVGVGILSNWPYEFLDCNEPYSVLVYLGLLAVSCLFFYAVFKTSVYFKGTKGGVDQLRATLIESGVNNASANGDHKESDSGFTSFSSDDSIC